MKYFVYIVKCNDETLYTGYTNNIRKRIFQHNNSNRGAHYTKSRRPVKLAYVEKFLTKSEALRREKEIKNLRRKKKLELIKKNR